MRIGDWTVTQRPAPGWSPPKLVPRAGALPTVGGGATFSNVGHISDEQFALQWEYLDACPSVLAVQADAEASTIVATCAAAERLAIPINAAAFYGISAARLYLRLTGVLTGNITIEIWTHDTVSGDPGVKVGVLGYRNVADLAAAFRGEDFYGVAAWPLDMATTPPGYLVLNGGNLTGAGTVDWGGFASGGDIHYKYTAATWGHTHNQILSAAVWSGGSYNILMGLCGAQGGGQVYGLDVEDGQLYQALLVDVEGRWTVTPSPRGGALATPPASAGIAERVQATFQLVSGLNE